MAVLIVLLVTFGVAIAVQFFGKRSINLSLSGCIALAAMFLFAGVSHFILDDGMVKMLPGWIPLRYPIIYVTGLVEIAMGIGFLLPRYSRLTGMIAIAFLVCVFPSNVYAAINSVEFGGNVNGPIYLLFRGPMQFFLIAWTWFVAVR